MNVQPSESTDQTSTWYNPKRATTKLRHKFVIEKFNELMNLRVNGMRPCQEDVYLQTSVQTGYSKKTIENIISRDRKG